MLIHQPDCCKECRRKRLTLAVQKDAETYNQEVGGGCPLPFSAVREVMHLVEGVNVFPCHTNEQDGCVVVLSTIHGSRVFLTFDERGGGHFRSLAYLTSVEQERVNNLASDLTVEAKVQKLME